MPRFRPGVARCFSPQLERPERGLKHRATSEIDVPAFHGTHRGVKPLLQLRRRRQINGRQFLENALQIAQILRLGELGFTGAQFLQLQAIAGASLLRGQRLLGLGCDEGDLVCAETVHRAAFGGTFHHANAFKPLGGRAELSPLSAASGLLVKRSASRESRRRRRLVGKRVRARSRRLRATS